ncbi:peptidylprolyl isomerase [Massilia sp. TS11]|uniref:peptidylprolyl isomerase n=1 Tax=Massilia sp. TS11 TaxID=2908003 RepID=UPI0035A2A6FB
MRTARLLPLTAAVMLACALAQAQTPAAAPAPKAPDAAKPAGFTPPNANLIDAIAVVVNDEVITRNEVTQRVAQIGANMQAQGIPLPAPAELKRQVVERMITERAQIQMAKEMGVKVDDLQLDRTIARIAEGQKMSAQEFRDRLEKEGTKFADFREEIRGQIMVQRLREYEVDRKIQISEAEIDSYLLAEDAANKERFEVNLSQILIGIPENASPEQIARAKAKADEVLRQLRTGADFAKMAATYSDSQDALKGGEVGWRQPERLQPVFGEPVAKLPKGGLSPVIRSASGFHILKVVDKRSLADAQQAEVVQQTHVRHILIKVTPAVTANDAKRKLADIKERLLNKAAKFEDLAKLFSNDSTAAKGGDLGWVAPDDVMPEFRTAMDALKPGQLSDIVETPFGFHLIEVLERKAEDQSKEKQRAAARQVLYERKAEEMGEEWARQIRDRAYVEFRDKD